MNRTVFFIFRIILCLSFAAGGFSNTQRDLKEADSHFSKRGQGVEHIHAAQRIYYRIIKDSKQDVETRLDAFDKFAKLSLFEGEIAKIEYGTERRQARKIFKQCMEVSDFVSPKKIGMESAEYNYWYAICVGLWGKSMSRARIIWHGHSILKKTKQAIKTGQSQFKEFENYGFSRIEGGMYGRKSLSFLRLYKPEKSLKLLDEVISHGVDIYIVYVLKATTLVSMGKKAEARKVLLDAESELSDRLTKNTIPADFLPENKLYLNLIRRKFKDFNL